MSVAELVRAVPKAELHLHIEGTLEPELMFALARRNGVDLPFADVESVRQAYRFTDLQSFLDIYYQAGSVLRNREDYAQLMADYLDRAAADGVVHAEIFVDPQSHTHRGVGWATFMGGFREAMADAERRHGLTTALILCFLRHLPPEDAVATITAAEGHLDGVVAVGLDSSEVGHPPQLFEEAYRRAQLLGLRAVAHAGEEGPPSYIAGALDVLGAERIDHGVRCLEDADLVARLRTEQVPLTVCPYSNVALRVVPRLEVHPLPHLIAEGLKVTVNSDDPAYFGGYVGENYTAAAQAFGWDENEVVRIAINSIEASFLDPAAKAKHLEAIQEMVPSNPGG